MIEVPHLLGLTTHLGQLKAISGFHNVRRLGVCVELNTLFNTEIQEDS